MLPIVLVELCVEDVVVSPSVVLMGTVVSSVTVVPWLDVKVLLSVVAITVGNVAVCVEVETVLPGRVLAVLSVVEARVDTVEVDVDDARDVLSGVDVAVSVVVNVGNVVVTASVSVNVDSDTVVGSVVGCEERLVVWSLLVVASVVGSVVSCLEVLVISSVLGPSVVGCASVDDCTEDLMVLVVEMIPSVEPVEDRPRVE